ncbi:MAG: AAA family ATPase [Parcubacteria group bacterium]|nr:AAA family ATPase [Parcubacteria group bacterium]
MLKRLEISGFKSFAKKISLEFPGRVSAIVGPNGSGKSNIADAIRWVMGEQSLKALRTKDGEDLIFSGSNVASRIGKASAELIFDNISRWFPVDLDEVVISRKSYRGGENQYLINNSPVRLKDVVEMLAKVGVGSKGYSIIAQGAADSLLAASDKERREMIEEALGLKEFRLKKNETERKLSETDNNLAQARVLIDEISPRLKTLSRLALKVKEREDKAARLKILETQYFAGELNKIKSKKQSIEERKNLFEKELAAAKNSIFKLREDQNKEEEVAPASLNDLNRLNLETAKLDEIETKLTRDLGRVEGLMEAELETEKLEYQPVTLSYAKASLENLRQILKDGKVSEALNFLDELIRKLISGKIVSQQKTSVEKNLFLKKQEKDIKNQLAEIFQKKDQIKEEINKLNFAIAGWRERLAGIKQGLAQEEKKFSAQEEIFRSVVLEEDKIGLEENQVLRFAEEAGIAKDSLAILPAGPVPDFYQIQKLRREVESIMNVDPEVLKEHDAVSLRHQFLTTQTGDLEKASASLRDLIRELDQKIDRDFRAGLAEISEEFNRYFRMIFGGGRANLYLVSEKKEKYNLEGENSQNGDIAENDAYAGCAISAEIPGKKIKGLNALSGGERSLTALSLLFGIVAVNSPPFLVFDEIDAALDESNSRRFANIFKDLSQKTQFVIITHNRETMSEADVLYGVTLAEDGSSKIISLKFSEKTTVA